MAKVDSVGIYFSQLIRKADRDAAGTGYDPLVLSQTYFHDTTFVYECYSGVCNCLHVVQLLLMIRW